MRLKLLGLLLTVVVGVPAAVVAVRNGKGEPPPAQPHQQSVQPHQLGGPGPGNLPNWGPTPGTFQGIITITSGNCPQIGASKTFSLNYEPDAAGPAVFPNGQVNPRYVPVVGGQAYVWGSVELGYNGPGTGSTFLVGIWYDGRLGSSWTPHLCSFPISFVPDMRTAKFTGPPLNFSCSGLWSDRRVGTSGTFTLTVQ